VGTIPLSLETLEKSIHAVEEALKAGYRPQGKTGHGPGAIATAAHSRGLDEGTVRHHLRVAKNAHGIEPDWSLYAPPDQDQPIEPPDVDEPVPDVSTHPMVINLRDDNARLKRELKAVARENLDAENVRTVILGLTEHTPAPPKWLVDSKPATGHAGVPMTIWSDWHAGEVVSREEVNGVNEFNMAICEARVQRLVERTIDLCFNHMVGAEYPGIVISILGDMLSGEIHQELAETNEDDLMPVMLRLLDLMIWALRTMADHFGSVFVPCVPGNHGRQDIKPRAKRNVHRNFDWLLYCLLERHFADKSDNRIRFMIPDAGEVLFSVYGHRYMGLHGHDMGTRGGDGIIGALGPIMRGEIKTRSSQAQIGRDYDTLLIGHWHQPLSLPRVIVNNALKGYDEFARSRLRAIFTPPSQNLWFHHPKRGITCRWEILLEDPVVVLDAPWVSVFEEQAA
jgi:hypothetical protein